MYYYQTNPLSGINHFVNQMANMMNEFDRSVEVETSTFRPRVDIIQTDNSYQIIMDLPGVDKNNVNIRVNDERVLVISGEKVKPENENTQVIRNERIYGKFERSFNISDDADMDKINAKFENGLLTVEVAKKEKIQPKEIEISIK